MDSTVGRGGPGWSCNFVAVEACGYLEANVAEWEASHEPLNAVNFDDTSLEAEEEELRAVELQEHVASDK